MSEVASSSGGVWKYFVGAFAAFLAVGVYSAVRGDKTGGNAPSESAAESVSAVVTAAKTENAPAVNTVEPSVEKAAKTPAEQAAETVLANESLWLDPVNDSLTESSNRSEWEYAACWFEDLDFDGTPEFIIGGWNPGWQFGQCYVLYRIQNGRMERINSEKPNGIYSEDYPFTVNTVVSVSNYNAETHFPGITGTYAGGAEVVKDKNGKYRYVIPVVTESPVGGYELRELSVSGNTFREELIAGYNIGYDEINYRLPGVQGYSTKEELDSALGDFYSGSGNCETRIGAIPCTKIMRDRDTAWFKAGSDTYSNAELNNPYISEWYDGMTHDEKLAALTASYNSYSLEFSGSYSRVYWRILSDSQNGEKNWFHEYDFY